MHASRLRPWLAGAVYPVSGRLFNELIEHVWEDDGDIPGPTHRTTGDRLPLGCCSTSRHIIVAMSWGDVELEPEVRAWYLSLDEDNQARVQFDVDRRSRGVSLKGTPSRKATTDGD